MSDELSAHGFGRDWPELDFVLFRGFPRGHIALSAGSAADSPARAHKGDPEQPNEDAVFACTRGTRSLLAVADGHHGIASSHALIEALLPFGAPDGPELPPSLLELQTRLPGLAYADCPGPSASTLLIAVLEHETGEGFGLCFGDSSLWQIDANGARRVHAQNQRYVNPSDPGSLDPRRAHELVLRLEQPTLLLACTDGIDECCYRQPERSIGAAHLAALFDPEDLDSFEFAQALAELACEGVGGNPGGEDNFAFAALEWIPPLHENGTSGDGAEKCQSREKERSRFARPLLPPRLALFRPVPRCAVFAAQA